jgi:ABC-2 type transport system permease protein
VSEHASESSKQRELASRSSAQRHFAPGTFTPRPGPGSPWRMLAAQSGTELRLAFRNGEQVLLTLLIPVVLLIGLSTLDVVPLPAPRIAAVTPGVLALAVLSTAFTGQAIALGFDRRYGVIRRLAATALPRWLLVAGRFVAIVGVVAIQVAVLCALAAGLGWRPEPAGLGWAALLVLLGCAAFGALGILLGGTLRAEITLAVANVVWFVLLLAGGIVVPLAQLPEPLATVGALLPSGALAEGLRGALVAGQPPGVGPVLVLLGWAAAAGALAVRTVKLR